MDMDEGKENKVNKALEAQGINPDALTAEQKREVADDMEV